MASRAASAALDSWLYSDEIDPDAKSINATPLDLHLAPRLQLGELRGQCAVGAGLGVGVAVAAGVAAEAAVAAKSITFSLPLYCFGLMYA